MFKAHQQIELTAVLTGGVGENLRLGDTGVVMHVHLDEAAYVVEFLSLDWSESIIADILRYQVLPVISNETTHARHAGISA